ncbi:rhodanese-like domain-containing protein [Streptomyces sp. NPDC098789]|uniref:rhodanese-like domain-containing protein n=1 Tax=unclassified Streptomyces TaxID=2593676 RepID=UPI0036572958
MNFGPLPSVDVAAVPSEGFVLDVREDDEWAAGHVEGALHIPMSDFVARFGELTEAMDAIEGAPRVHVMCRVGGRSAQVTQYLVRQEIDAVNIDGGMQAWDAAGRPMVTDNGNPAFVL